jgi:hypothetical protein
MRMKCENTSTLVKLRVLKCEQDHSQGLNGQSYIKRFLQALEYTSA